MEDEHEHEHGGCCHHILDDEDLFEQLLSYLPVHLRADDIPKETKKEYLTKFLLHYRKRFNEEEEGLKMHEQYKQTVAKNFAPYNKFLYDINKWGFVPSFRDAVESGDPEIMRTILNEVYPGIYAFDMLTPEFCDALLDEIEYFENWCVRRGLKVQRPNTMNNYGAILDDFGFEPTLDLLMRQYIAPFASFLYPHITGLDTHHGFVVSYELGKDTNLDFHIDDADVTLNVCLGKQFEGGNLYFGGVRCAYHQSSAPRKEEEFIFEHKRGQGIFHLSKHRHLAQHIKSGTRHNLIMWCRSSSFREQTEKEYYTKRLCPPWCGYDAKNDPDTQE